MAPVGPVCLLALLGAFASSACSIDIQSDTVAIHEEKRFTVTAGEPVDLRVTTFDGGIHVRSSDDSEVRVDIARHGPDQATAEALVVNDAQDGNRIVIEAPNPRVRRNDITFGRSPAVHLTVTVPRRVALQARTGDGVIDVQDLEGTLDMNSGDGRIAALHVEGEVRARTGDGSIRIDDVTGRVDADSGDGPIEIAGRLEEVTVRTGDGNVRIEALAGSTMKSDWHITTGDGRILLRVPPGFNAAVDASTGDGLIRVEGISGPAEDDGRDGRRRVVGQLGSGGQTLRLRSGDGSIDVFP